MRKFALALAIVAAPTAAPPAFAQRASLADRVAVLEQRASDNQANLDLLNQVNQLKSELQSLRAQVEELQQQHKQLQDSSKAEYLDTDNRLNRLEGGAGAPVPAAAPQPQASVPAPPPAVRDSAPVVHGDAGLVAQSGDERAAYDAAFNVLKSGQYAESARLFQEFLSVHPSGTYAPNALYWLGESYYVTQNYQLAQEQFQTLLDRYPTHDKAAGALLKVGLAQFGLKQVDAAERTLADVANRYPGTDAARTAVDRLNAIQLSRLRN
jgi:tol-pal system protein YbgF